MPYSKPVMPDTLSPDERTVARRYERAAVQLQGLGMRNMPTDLGERMRLSEQYAAAQREMTEASIAYKAKFGDTRVNMPIFDFPRERPPEGETPGFFSSWWHFAGVAAVMVLALFIVVGVGMWIWG